MIHKQLSFLFFFFLFYAVQGQYALTPFIRIDQFGYRINSSKVAVIASPQTGFDASTVFTPSSQYQVRKLTDNSVFFSGTVSAWQSGATDTTSGDKAWWFDFSAVNVPGNYYVFDVGRNVGSYSFAIGDEVYNNVLRAAMRMFFYNRCNAVKTLQNAGVNWADGASFVGAGQDGEARSVTDQNNPATAKDLSGGWWDAGDYNKYVTFAVQPVHQLLDAYDQNKTIWTDNFNIPESGNGIPDIIDEIKWEVDWLKKMQLADGSSLIKMGLLVNSDGQATLPPSTDIRKRYYYPGGCSSSTIALSGMLAHAALVFKEMPALAGYSTDLQTRAIAAWNNYNTSPRQENCDDGTIQAGDADNSLDDQTKNMVQAAVYLFALTNNTRYRDSVDANYTKFTSIGGYWWGPYETASDALLYYTKLPGATPSVVTTINTKKLNAASTIDFYNWHNSEKDPYRSYVQPAMYHWGGLNTRANVGSINYDMVYYQLDAANTGNYLLRTEELLHYFHGVNPFNMVYLTNMGSYGAKNSVTEIFHSWYKDGSDWDNINSPKGGPPPGYVPGGPNKTYKDGNGNCTLSPPCNQPRQKSYRNWNGVWPDASWEVTEPGIYYQSAYVKLLSKFITTQNGNVVTASSNISTHDHISLTISPNPVQKGSLINVAFEAANSKPASIVIRDMQGKKIASQTSMVVRGVNSVVLHLKPMTAGVYCLQLLQGKASYPTEKFIVY